MKIVNRAPLQSIIFESKKWEVHVWKTQDDVVHVGLINRKTGKAERLILGEKDPQEED